MDERDIHWLATAVANNETGCQFAVPDAKYNGDMYFITDSKNEIILILYWNGAKWVYEFKDPVYKVKALPE